MFNLNLFKKILHTPLKNIKKEDSLKFKGVFELESFDKNNNTIDYIRDDNIIVNTSFDILTSLLADGDANSKLRVLKLGDGGIYNSQIKTPVATETDLYNPLETVTIADGYTSADILFDSLNKSISWTWTLQTNEGNGSGVRIYSEAGFFSSGDVMFSKKNFTEVVKTIDKKLIVKWTIQII